MVWASSNPIVVADLRLPPHPWTFLLLACPETNWWSPLGFGRAQFRLVGRVPHLQPALSQTVFVSRSADESGHSAVRSIIGFPFLSTSHSRRRGRRWARSSCPWSVNHFHSTKSRRWLRLLYSPALYCAAKQRDLLDSVAKRSTRPFRLR